jgi:hypothetical protein
VLSVIFSLMIPPVATLMVVALLNAIGRLVFRRWLLETPDLVVIFTILFVGTAMAAEWMNVCAPLWHSFGLYAENNDTYRNRILPHLVPWLFHTTAEPIREYGIGGYKFPYALTKLGVWLPIFLGWMGLFGFATLAMLCINALMRRLWTQQERLAFPIIQVPMLLCQPQSPLWRSRYLWGAFVVTFAIGVINGLHVFFPWIPRINVRFLAALNDYFTTPPWNQVGWIPVGLFPYMAAIGVFVPNDLLFSSVLFYFVRKGMQVITAAMGYEQGVFGGGYLVPQPPYFSEQSWGAFLGLFVSVIYASRGYLKEIWREIKTGENPEAGYALSARAAFIGLIVSLMGLIGLGVAVGLPWWLVTIYVALFMAFSVVVTRLRAQLGAPIHEMAFMGPHQLMIAFTGTQNLTESTIAKLMTTFHFMNRLHRTHPMPYQLESMKMGEIARLNQRALFFVMAAASAAGHLSGRGVQHQPLLSRRRGRHGRQHGGRDYPTRRQPLPAECHGNRLLHGRVLLRATARLHPLPHPRLPHPPCRVRPVDELRHRLCVVRAGDCAADQTVCEPLLRLGGLREAARGGDWRDFRRVRHRYAAGGVPPDYGSGGLHDFHQRALGVESVSVG